MIPSDKPAFARALQLACKTVRQPAPDVDVMDVFWAHLERYPLAAVLRAISLHSAVSEFAPTPAALLRHLPKESDGRPDADEAWAIALRSLDERDTVVWTAEIAQAFGAARPVLDGGDEVGARMAFKAAYGRIVEQARHSGIKAAWIVSAGFGAQQREQVVSAAVREGRLQLADARAAVPLLAAPDDEAPVDAAQVEAQRAKLREILGSLESAWERNNARRSAQQQADSERLAAAKAESAARVAAYEGARA